MSALIESSSTVLLLLPVEMLVAALRYLDDKSLVNAVFASKRFLSVCKGDPVLRKRMREYVTRQKNKYREMGVNMQLRVEIIRIDMKKYFGQHQNKNMQVMAQTHSTIQHHHVPRAKSVSRTFEDDRKKEGGKIRENCKKRVKPYTH
ncbi:hypothetical protein FQR65_LT09496 [Abscondita terminalis]|nr:hypothetical protein FQR65_LT09496 [Abscondita terminalis]